MAQQETPPSCPHCNATLAGHDDLNFYFRWGNVAANTPVVAIACGSCHNLIAVVPRG
jgi:hypothetical protein